MSTSLCAQGFHQSKVDPCLFLVPNIICIIYVDNCLFFAKEATMIDATIESLKTDFDLETETDVSAFLGIHIQ